MYEMLMNLADNGLLTTSQINDARLTGALSAEQAESLRSALRAGRKAARMNQREASWRNLRARLSAIGVTGDHVILNADGSATICRVNFPATQFERLSRFIPALLAIVLAEETSDEETSDEETSNEVAPVSAIG